MKKRIIVLSLTILAASLVLIGCGSKYSDVKKVNEKYIAVVEDYLTDIDNAGDAKDAVKAINKFADALEKVWPEMQQLSEKYPELKDSTNVPAGLEELQKKAEEVGMKMGGSMMKLMPYMGDPEVQKAQQRLMKIMSQN